MVLKFLRVDTTNNKRLTTRSRLCYRPHREIARCGQKASITLVFPLVDSIITDGLTDQRTDGRIDKASYRVACPHLKTEQQTEIDIECKKELDRD